MKKVISFLVCAAIAASVQAASVGWSIATGSTTYNGDAYKVFVIGQNGVTSVAQITALLDQGKDVSAYAFGSGTITAATTSVAASASGKTLTPDTYPATYTSFTVLFDSESPSAGSSKYVAISDQANQTKTLANSASSSITFATGNVSSIVSSASNWKSYGAIPEPTTVALLALGLAALGLKRKVA